MKDRLRQSGLLWRNTRMAKPKYKGEFEPAWRFLDLLHKWFVKEVKEGKCFGKVIKWQRK